HALEVYTREQHPQLWVVTQSLLGNSLSRQSEITSVQERASLLESAIVAFRQALTGLTREEKPAMWAEIQAQLGLALGRQENMTSGEDSTRLLEEALAAFRQALAVDTLNSVFEVSHWFDQ